MSFYNIFLVLEPPSPEVCYDGKQISKYGCCWDGITAATGPNGQGCPGTELLFLHFKFHFIHIIVLQTFPSNDHKLTNYDGRK